VTETIGPLEKLLRRLDLQQLDRDLFLGDPGRGEGRLFGGLVAAQSVVAAARTVEEGEIHSLHAYFLRPGRHGLPIQFVVHRIRDGQTYTTRRVVAHQAGEAIFSLEASYTRLEEGISHQDPMASVPPPEGLPDWDTVRSDRRDDPGRWSKQSPIEIRACDPEAAASPDPQPPFRQVWMRPKGVLPEDPVVHAAVITFSSDRGMLSTVSRWHGLQSNRSSAASLDHAMWFHRPPRWDGWVLYTTASHAAHNARALIFGTMYRQGGELLASVAQEGLFRMGLPNR
jgi:acyl-CoA thioesterase-2